MTKSLLFGLLLSTISLTSYSQTFVPLVEGQKSSFRGIATYKDRCIWVSGSNGTIGYSKDRGNTWNWVSPKGYETLDFRSIAVISEKEVIVASAGTPALVLRTADAGKSWQKIFEDPRKEAFFDALVMDKKLGYILGDPIDGSFQLLRTTNKGKTWEDISSQFIFFADEGEAAFAASNSSMQLIKQELFIGTGGKYASFFHFNPKKPSIDKYDCPIWNGESSTGTFAIDFKDEKYGILVGGNYLADTLNTNNILITSDAGKTWQKPESPIFGYRSDVQFINDHIVIATGTSGTDISYDKGVNWKNISKLSFNSIGISKDKKTIYLTGSKGNIFRLIL